MGYRILVDENIDPGAAELLRERGHDTVNIEAVLEKGVGDSQIAEHARRHDRLVLTNDTDFLGPRRQHGISVLYCPENTMPAHEIAARVDEVGRMIPDQTDLPKITWLTEEGRR